MIRIIVFLLSLLFCSYCFSAVPLYQFDTSEQQQTFNRLTQELRCVVCESQSLAESNSPLAQDIKQQIYSMLKQQQSEKAVKGYMLERYGDSVLYKPPLQSNTYVLWILPFLLLIIVLIGLPLWVRKRVKV